jgi:hypothetical protein
MKERPILFSGEMVKAILEGRKTQTRRVVKPQPHCPNATIIHDDNVSNAFVVVPLYMNDFDSNQPTNLRFCPYGIPGDRLWGKETWCSRNGSDVVYRADCGSDYKQVAPWKPSIFMPRWASRITLEIVSVRVERLQEITEDDVVAEGIEFPCEEPETSEHPVGCVCEYRNLWDRINGNKHPWSSNPWVWRIEFKRKGCRQ